MKRFLAAALLASIIIVFFGIVLSLVLGDASRALAARLTFSMSPTERFVYHVALRLLVAVALTALIALTSSERPRLAIVVTSAWALAYVPGMLMLADADVLPLSAAVVTIAWGWFELAAAALVVSRVLGSSV